MIWYHFTGIIFIHGFITLISYTICNKSRSSIFVLLPKFVNFDFIFVCAVAKHWMGSTFAQSLYLVYWLLEEKKKQNNKKQKQQQKKICSQFHFYFQRVSTNIGCKSSFWFSGSKIRATVPFNLKCASYNTLKKEWNRQPLLNQTWIPLSYFILLSSYLLLL